MIRIPDLLKALGDETRLRLAHLFLQTNEDICVCEMVDTLKLPQYQISKHLTILKNAGLLHASRKGTWVYYSLNRDEAAFWRDLSKALRRHLEQPIFRQDAAELKKRLALRENGRCVVGFVAIKALRSSAHSTKANR
ncbi:metalloregulator ArsR/SmtB family transcription factor [bacterium]|nr:metalloregulator ArsR/SmtB family transcription factor [bacterium]RIK70872.1 MAG: ArsR family transcriptional regulator [candidate division KSB1 bacterium]